MSYETSSELLSLLQEEVSDTSPSSETTTRFQNLLNRAHKAIVAGGGELNLDDRGNPIRRPVIFPWALATQPKSLTLLPSQTGTANCTLLSASVLSSSINSATTDMTGWHIRFNQTATVYYISTHSGTSITLDSAYVDITATTVSFEAFKLIYTLGSNDILMFTDKGRVHSAASSPAEIALTDAKSMFEAFPLPRVVSKLPTKCAILKQVGGTFTVQFNSFSPEYRRVDFSYVPIPADLNFTGSSDPIIPAGSAYRILLVHLAAFYHLRKRDDDRAKSNFETAEGLFNSLTTESYQNTESNDPMYGHFSPWQGDFDGFDTNGSMIVDV